MNQEDYENYSSSLEMFTFEQQELFLTGNRITPFLSFFPTRYLSFGIQETL